jgi:hypothetical protein
MRLPRLVVGCVVAAACAAPAAAQWIDHPTPGIPRTRDGKPNLAAPAPRTADRKPDLSGLWSIGGLSAVALITDVEMLPWAQALYKERLDTYGHDDPAANCLPEGPRSGLAGLDALRIVQTPNLIVILYESGPARQVHLDGRPHPKDPTPTWMGYSVGRWEGDTLVVETTGFNDRTWLDITYTDPKTYTKPFSVKLPVFYQADTDLLENVCLENEKDRPKLVGRPQDEKASEKKVARTPDAPRLPLFAVSDTQFVFQSLGGQVRFVPDAAGVATQLILTIVEGDIPAMRK